jgi:hypothetical protein
VLREPGASRNTSAQSDSPRAALSDIHPFPAEPELSSAALVLTGRRAGNFNRAASDLLRFPLPGPDLRALYAFIAEPFPRGSFSEAMTRRNEAIRVIAYQAPGAPETLDFVLRLLSDEDIEPFVKDFMLQYVPDMVDRLPDMPEQVQSGTDAAPVAFSGLRQAVAGQLSESGTSLPGTALICMSRLSEAGRLFDAGTVVEAAETVAGDTAQLTSVRATAFQVAAAGGSAGLLDEALALARSPAVDTRLRMSCVAFLASSGGTDARDMLALLAPEAREAAENGDPRLYTAVTAAAERLEQ